VKKYIRSTLNNTESFNSLSSFQTNSRSSFTNNNIDDDDTGTFVMGFQDDIIVDPVYPKTAAPDYSPDLNALKLVSKDVFWRRVKSGTERPDALAREVLAQAWVWHVAQKRINDPMNKSEQDVPIVKLCGVYESMDGFVMELELMEKIDLYEKLVADGVFNEDDARQIIKQLIGSIAICNNAGIAHRDVKLTNITFPQPRDKDCDNGLKIRLADFGMAGFMDPSTKQLHGRCGTPGYVAPDILNAKLHEGYSVHVDMFSVGVVAYTLLCGYEPFYGTDDQELIRVNKSVEYQFHLPEWAGISLAAKDFIANCLLPSAGHRMTAEQALLHPWMLYGDHHFY
jgi:calcium/calmodulin-dependent protein kinase I